MRRNDHSYIHLFPSDTSKKDQRDNQMVKKRKDSLESDEDGIEPDTVIDDLVSTLGYNQYGLYGAGYKGQYQIY